LAIVDKHDRPWSNRPVFGLVRTMTGASTAKKFDAAQYIRQHGCEAAKPLVRPRAPSSG
jgi:deoxyribodipyrimidine photo-lyase